MTQTKTGAYELPSTRRKEVIMYYRIVVDGFNFKLENCTAFFGKIEGRHKDAWTAESACSKANKSPKSIFKQEVVFIEGEDKLSVGDVYSDLCFQAIVDKTRKIQIEHCASVIEKLRTGVDSESACKTIYPQNQYRQDIPFEEWMDKFSSEAELILENKTIEIQKRAEEQAKRQSVIDDYNSMAAEICYTFPAVKGIQAGKEYYVAQVPFKMLVKFFNLAEEGVSAELRAQRKVNKKHAEEISDYVLNNRTDYVLPSIIVSVNKSMGFDPISMKGLADRLGVLNIQIDSKLLINDGQHRRLASEYFIEKDKSLGDETISVIFYYDEGLEHSKQLFSDLNANSSRPNAAISSLYDLRSSFNSFVLDAIKRQPFSWLYDLVDLENVTIAKKSEKVWSLVHWKKFTTTLFGIKEGNFENLTSDELAKYNAFFDLVVGGLFENTRSWQLVHEGSLATTNLRESQISGHAVYLESLALAISYFSVDYEDEQLILSSIKDITSINPDKDNECWKNLCIVADRMVKNADSVKLTAAHMRSRAGIELSKSMIEVKQRHNL
ncbi:DNA sulfur modification protein DndB [Pseudoalteromonas sp. GutCa3]|uniref:DNA sulfur modification protein DndB n=1 Tax=Pseudoalteromonas sp. GutCa3 TaxID=888433 RepID=UPI000C32B516|nr:DNA sulfur modification protein DndB [Pseudoalteromonas sp. GutCa3]PKG68678.1 hypothetical protein CXF64_20365 [Pseudoalteromonas sp. GutCa3]